MPDPRAPVLVGVGQAEQHVDDPAAAKEPIDLLADAARAADTDTGASLLKRADTVAVVSIVSWPYPDPGALLGRRLALPGVRRTVTTTVGGNSPQLLLNTFGEEVQQGRAGVVLIGGSECVHTRWRARREPRTLLPWSEPDDPLCPEVLGDGRAGSSDEELTHGASVPTSVYPLFETALRAAAGRSADEHQRVVTELWSGFSAVAAGNPHAWSQRAFTPGELRRVGPENRMVTFPYPKRLCANIDVDQAAAVLLCSYEIARAAGVPADRLVFLRSGADAHDHFFVSERDRLDRSPAIAAAGAAALAAVGAGRDDVARFDLYSCFPSAVQVAMGALGLPGPGGGDDRPLTLTGGLGFAGGPANNYPTHAVAAMVAACRADPGSLGLVTAVGWYLTKHSVGCYSTTPPADGFRRVDPAETQQVVDAQPARETAGPYTGAATVEATAVPFTRDGEPESAVVTALTPDGRRVLAASRDETILRALTEELWEGTEVQVVHDGSVNQLAP